MGNPSEPGRDQSDRPADQHQGGHGKADAGRARQARSHSARGRGTSKQEFLRRGDPSAGDPGGAGDQQAAILRADGEARAVDLVFQAVHRNNADPKVLAYKYLETLPHLASGENDAFWVIPGELTQAIRAITEAFGDYSRMGAPRDRQGQGR